MYVPGKAYLGMLPATMWCFSICRPLQMHLTHNSLFSMLFGSLRETLGHYFSYKSGLKPKALGPSVLNLSCNTFRKTQIPLSTKST